MDALQETQNRSQASISTTLPRDASRLIGAPLTHADGESDSNSGATGPAGGVVGEQAARAAIAGKMDRRSMVVLQERLRIGGLGLACEPAWGLGLACEPAWGLGLACEPAWGLGLACEPAWV